MKAVKLCEIKRGDYFIRRPLDSIKECGVYIRGDYERSSKKYSCVSFVNSCKEIFLKGSTVVYVDIDF